MYICTYRPPAAGCRMAMLDSGLCRAQNARHTPYSYQARRTEDVGKLKEWRIINSKIDGAGRHRARSELVKWKWLWTLTS